MPQVTRAAATREREDRATAANIHGPNRSPARTSMPTRAIAVAATVTVATTADQLYVESEYGVIAPVA